jgi:hypothetical protein
MDTPDINVAQNSPSSIRLLAAQRQLYSEAKYVYRFRMVVSLVLACAAPPLFLLWPELKTVLGFVGIVWACISKLVLEGMETGRIKQAATIQEEFDTMVFRLPWNSVLTGEKVTAEIIAAASRRFKGNHELLKNWYTPGENVYPFSVLLCQRSSLVWDWRLRREYASVIVCITGVILLLGIIVGISARLSLLDYLLAVLLPSTSVLLDGIKVARDHIKLAGEKERAERTVMRVWSASIESGNVSVDDSRRLQDCIFLLRNRAPVVDDWWYWIRRTAYEEDMRVAVEQFEKELAQRSV